MIRVFSSWGFFESTIIDKNKNAAVYELFTNSSIYQFTLQVIADKLNYYSYLFMASLSKGWFLSFSDTIARFKSIFQSMFSSGSL